tara:strand:+ start:5444 stop:6199 length:756 start_codon:yes stop_codon:yes gene_type:complete
MAFDYVSTANAQSASGLRMIVVGGVPSPWGEAAKGLFHVKGIDWQAVRLDQTDAVQMAWSGRASAPVVFWQDEAPIDQAIDIVQLAERIAPEPALLPADHGAEILRIVSDLAAPGGLGWQRRLQQVHAGHSGGPGFHPKIAAYLGAKYGYDAASGAGAGAAVGKHLRTLAHKLAVNGGIYYVGDRLSAADIYAAAFMALFDPLPQDQCAMHPATRVAFSTLDDTTRAALDPSLIAHRDRIYADWLQLPLAL